MTMIEQNHELGCGQRMQWCAWVHGPPQELAGGETAQTQPKSIPVIDQEFDSRSTAIAENIQGAGERVLLPLVATQRREGVYPFAEIDRSDRQQNPQLGTSCNIGLGTEERRTERFGLCPLRGR